MGSRFSPGRYATTCSAAAVVACAATLLAPLGASAAPAPVVLHSFTGNDGIGPNSLLRDPSGTLYGTTTGGGHNGGGVVFALVPNGAGFDFSVIYEFCHTRRCPDGQIPIGPLIEDTQGNLYGATEGGGKDQGGTVFELMPNGTPTWTLVTLHHFVCDTNDPPDCPGGRFPSGGLTYLGALSGALYDGTAPLFGATQFGGAHFPDTSADVGVVYRLKFLAGHKSRQEKVLYSLCSLNSPDCTDGSRPLGSLIDVNGVLFGVTAEGGSSSDAGVIYKINTGNGNYTKLYSFCADGGQFGCPDGDSPVGALVRDRDGLFGVTRNGGADNNDNGVVFNFDSGRENVVYELGDQVGDGCSAIATSLSFGANHNLFGVASRCGANNEGVLYKLKGSTETVLYAFCSQPACADGAQPIGNIIVDPSGNLFGVTDEGGDTTGNPFGNGTVFEFTPP